MSEKSLSTNNNMQALLEGVYAQMSTYPGNYIKYDEFCAMVKKQYYKKICQDLLVDIYDELKKLYPKVEFNESYRLKNSGEVFCAFRIHPQDLIVQNAIKQKIEKLIMELPVIKDDWVDFTKVASDEIKRECNEMGFESVRQAVECRFLKDYYEISQIDKDYVIRKRISFRTFAYFPSKKKDGVKVNGWDVAINDLADNIALKEQWYYKEKDKKETKPILKSYLSCTFERLQYEDKMFDGQKEYRKKILTNPNNAIWNTGLVDSVYDPIFCILQVNDHRNPQVQQDWVFRGFGTANNSKFQSIITDFPYLPQKAQYFDNPRELFYDITANRPTIGKEHIFGKDNIERLPLGFIKKGAPPDFDFEEEPQSLSKFQQEQYYKRLSETLCNNNDWLEVLMTRFENAVKRAISRVTWNYKTAIPVYYVTEHKMQLLLPLALEKNDTIDAALVCNHKYDETNGVNNYEGKTVFTLQMAYNNARLITRPDSDWLMADMCVKECQL